MKRADERTRTADLISSYELAPAVSARCRVVSGSAANEDFFAVFHANIVRLISPAVAPIAATIAATVPSGSRCDAFGLRSGSHFLDTSPPS
jgi:hypothetical protein